MRTTFFWGRLREKKKYQHIIANWCFSNASRYQTFFHIYIQFEQIMNSCDFHFGETHSKLFRGSLFLIIKFIFSRKTPFVFLRIDENQFQWLFQSNHILTETLDLHSNLLTRNTHFKVVLPTTLVFFSSWNCIYSVEIVCIAKKMNIPPISP